MLVLVLNISVPVVREHSAMEEIWWENSEHRGGYLGASRDGNPLINLKLELKPNRFWVIKQRCTPMNEVKVERREIHLATRKKKTGERQQLN